MPRIAVILNQNSGKKDSKNFIKQLLQRHPEVQSKIFFLDKNANQKDVVTQAWKEKFGTIAVAGGDGTISGIAAALVSSHIPAKLGILPIGTLNHFSKDLKIPLDLDQAFNVIIKGSSTYVDIAKVNDTYFINNSSLGLYSTLVTERENIRQMGVRKWAALIAAVFITLWKHPYVTLEFKTKGKKIKRETPFIFIGNNRYQLDGLKIGMREKLKEGILQLCITQKTSRIRDIKLLWAALRGKLIEQKDFDVIGLHETVINSKEKEIPVSHDGEVSMFVPPLRYRIFPKALHVIIP